MIYGSCHIFILLFVERESTYKPMKMLHSLTIEEKDNWKDMPIVFNRCIYSSLHMLAGVLMRLMPK